MRVVESIRYDNRILIEVSFSDNLLHPNVNKPKWFEIFDIYLSKMPLLMKCCHMLETFEPIQIDSITLLCASGNSLNRDLKARLNTWLPP